MHNLVLIIFTLWICSSTAADIAHARQQQVEDLAMHYIASASFTDDQADHSCNNTNRFIVYLIDNFDQEVEITPEMSVSHGEILRAILLSGRSDIEVRELNTSLVKGLARVFLDLADGACADAVLSSIPGSNYTYAQTSTLLAGKADLSADNIIAYKPSLLQIMREIAAHGFPSVQWLKQVDVNVIKLREDARKVVLIEALGKFNVPVFLPYGNGDTPHRGEVRHINLLSLADNSRIYSGLDPEGNRLPGYPYSPLNSGSERAWYDLVECPDSDDVKQVHLDINNDGYADFSYLNTLSVGYYDETGDNAMAPPLISEADFIRMIAEVEAIGWQAGGEQYILTAHQYNRLLAVCPDCPKPDKAVPVRELVWLNSMRYGSFHTFNAQCVQRGKIVGSSLIPPIKVKDYLGSKREKVVKNLDS